MRIHLIALCLALAEALFLAGCPNDPLIEKVANPAFSPAGGTFTTPQAVSISSTTTAASIRYTTDSTTPSKAAGTLYATPFDVSVTTTIRAIAFASGYADSEVVSATYTIVPEGKDGPRTVNSAGTIVNEYTTIGQNASAGATSIVVASVAELADGAQDLESGDLLLIIQMQGATLDTTDGVDYGAVTSLGGAGLYEFARVADVTLATNTVSLSSALLNSYLASGATQVVRVPQYTTLAIAAGASITAPAWNGSTGGVVAVFAGESVTLDGAIDVSGKGFRGGPADNDSSTIVTADVTTYRSASNLDGARKGESIGGFVVSYGRGAPANGGGGGNAYNAGGGGGANGRPGGAWTGQGVFDTSVTGGSAAWPLDPSYSTTASEGGGRGGYSCSNSNRDALSTRPGNTLWAGNYRREHGGLGGRPVDNDPASRLYFGGGGGAGDGNNTHAGAGGSGGGIVIVVAPQVTGTGGLVTANGSSGQPADSSSGDAGGDAAGGGGGSGAVVMKATTIGGITIEARGGSGGVQIVSNGSEAEGPGGGGGGGYVAVSSAIAIDVSGGLGGTTSSSALTEFPSNGATRGGTGASLISASFTLPGF